MATKTPNLNLVLPANGEYFNIWDQPMNGNWTIVDTVVGSLQAEIVTARGSASSLDARLSVGLNADGTPIASAEIVAARVSSIYGGLTPLAVPNELNDRLEDGDREVFTARSSLTALQDAVAFTGDQSPNNTVLSAANNFLTFTGPVVSLNGSVTSLIANINGYRQVVSTILTTTISGSAGTYYLKLNRVGGGTQYLNIITNTGTIGTYVTNGLLAMLTDLTTNFVTSGVKPGDVLNITGPGGNPNINQYVVFATNTQDPTNLTTNQIAVVGQFVNASTGLNYTLTDPVAPTLSFTGTAHAKTFTRVSGSIYVGRCTFDGTNVTALTIYALQGKYVGFTSVALSSGNYSLTIPHNLGYFPNRVFFYGSQASDFSQPLDVMSSADLSGGGSLQRSVIAQENDLTILVKNPTNGLFYKDYGGTSQTSGFLYVVAER